MKGLRFIFFTMMCVFLAVSCSQPAPAETVKKDDTVPPEKFFTVSAGGKVYRIHENGLVDSAYFQSFLNEHYGKPTVFDTTYQLEVTSDSVPERVHVFYTASGPGVYATVAHIYSGDTLIWADTLKLDDAAARSYYDNKPAYDLLKPYSAFYLVHRRQIPTAYEKGQGVNEPEIRSFFFGMLEDQKDSVYWKERLKTYTGTLIGHMFMMDGDIMIWDGRHKKFILYYAP